MISSASALASSTSALATEGTMVPTGVGEFDSPSGVGGGGRVRKKDCSSSLSLEEENLAIPDNFWNRRRLSDGSVLCL